MAMQCVIGVDIGGTCTDCVIVTPQGRVVLGKAFSTPPDFSEGIVDALSVAARELRLGLDELLAGTTLFLHSTTIAENAVTNGNLSQAGILTTRGFEDTLFMTRGAYGRWSGLAEEEQHDPVHTDKPPSIVPRRRVRSVKERTDRKGQRLRVCDPAEVQAAVQELVDQGVDAVGVCFLWSFANPANEQIAGDAIRQLWPDMFLALSHEIAPVLGEYERTSTVALNCALGPVVKGYLHNLQARLTERGFGGILLVAQAYGGLVPLEIAAERPVGMIESGPASGVLGAKALGERIGLPNIIAADMGGTTFKVGVIREGEIEYQREPMVYRYHFALPKMDIISLGLAGGSIIFIEPRTGIPQIGPRSAGSYPGPVCYDHGGLDPTVTDVDAILGYLHSSYFLGGRETLNIEKARRVFHEKIAAPLGMADLDAAAAIYRLTNSMIYDLLHKVTIEAGLDPRQYALVSFGGTAGMHVAAYGEELGVSHIVIPHSASVHGAFGLVTSDIVHEDQITHPLRAPADPREVNDLFDAVGTRLSKQLEAEGFRGERILLRRSIDMRYRRQVHLLNVPLVHAGPVDAPALERTGDHFEELYRTKYGKDSAFREAGIEMIAFRVRAIGLVEKPALEVAAIRGRDPGQALVERRPAFVGKTGTLEEVAGYDFDALLPGNVVDGPAIVWSPITTVVVNPDQLVQVDEYKNLIIRRR
jgi:N-methylhydantoinase A